MGVGLEPTKGELRLPDFFMEYLVDSAVKPAPKNRVFVVCLVDCGELVKSTAATVNVGEAFPFGKFSFLLQYRPCFSLVSNKNNILP